MPDPRSLIPQMPWWLLALLGAVFGGLVSVLVKPGLGAGETKISSNLGTAIRMLAVFPLAWAVVWAEGSAGQVFRITPRQWTFLLLSGVGTGLSWLFYFLAISKGEVNRVNPIDKTSLAFAFILAVLFLHEQIKWQTVTATVLVLLALFITLIPSRPAVSDSTTAPASVASQTTAPTSATADLQSPHEPAKPDR